MAVIEKYITRENYFKKVYKDRKIMLRSKDFLQIVINLYFRQNL